MEHNFLNELKNKLLARIKGSIIDYYAIFSGTMILVLIQEEILILGKVYRYRILYYYKYKDFFIYLIDRNTVQGVNGEELKQ